jgi:chemosensory pili system protein ChpB (putative protein-glutamate methylesterase)
MINSARHTGLRVGLLADARQRGGFRAFLERQGVQVVLDAHPAAPLPQSWNDAQVLLVAIGDSVAALQLERLMQRSPVPVVLSRGGMGRSESWGRGLLGKLEVLAGAGPHENRRSGPHTRPGLHVIPLAQSGNRSAARIVVLAGSLGGPEAVARFLRELPYDLSLALLLAQHVSEAVQNLLAAQLDRCGGWPVAVLSGQRQIEPGRAWLLPAQSRVAIDPCGLLRCCADPWRSAQKPDMNVVLSDVANAFGARCGAIMFSGLGGDGAQGCESIARRGGFVWVQSSDSCAVASLPEAARRSARIEFSGTPEELARELASRCQVQATSIN